MTEQPICKECQQVNCQCRAVLLKENKPEPSPYNAINKPEQPKSQCNCIDCNLPELESLGYEPPKPSRATEGKNTCVIESKTKVKNSKVAGQPLEQPTTSAWEAVDKLEALSEQPITEYKMKKFTREELQEIRDRAIHSAEDVPNNHWQRAYRQLADIADRLDAMEARTEDK